MVSNIDMADALLKRALTHRHEIGDHGDPYEASLLAGTIQFELEIIVREILHNLSLSLDYAAYEVIVRTGKPMDKDVCFPMVGRSFDSQNFRTIFEQSMPGVAANQPQMIDIFASFQPFWSKDNGWIGDFLTLHNQNKYENLTELSNKVMQIVKLKGSDEVLYQGEPDQKKLKTLPLTFLSGKPENTGSEVYSYIILIAINEELLSFLDLCLAGVRKIIQAIREQL